MNLPHVDVLSSFSHSSSVLCRCPPYKAISFSSQVCFAAEIHTSMNYTASSRPTGAFQLSRHEYGSVSIQSGPIQMYFNALMQVVPIRFHTPECLSQVFVIMQVHSVTAFHADTLPVSYVPSRCDSRHMPATGVLLTHPCSCLLHSFAPMQVCSTQVCFREVPHTSVSP